MNPIDNRLSWAQIWLTALFLSLVAAVILLIEVRGVSQLDTEQLKSFNEWQHWLRDGGMILLGFWFARQRAGGIPEASSTVTQTATSADGSKVSVTSPAHLPLPQLPVNPTPPGLPATKP